MNLSQLAVPTKVAAFEFPGMPGFSVTLSFISRDKLIKMRKQCTSNKLDKRSRQMLEEVDYDKFQELYNQEIIKGWTGLKLKYVAKLMPIDEAAIVGQEDVELEYSAENATVLMRNSAEFDAWVSAQIEDLENFTQKV